MNLHARFAICLLALGAVWIVAPPASAQPSTTYSIQSMGILGTGWSRGFGIDNKGSVCGLAGPIGEAYTQPFRANGFQITQLTAPPDLGGAGWAINDLGEVVGEQDFFGAAYYYRAARWRNGTRLVLPDLGFSSEAEGISNNGRIVGFVNTTANDVERHAAYWDIGLLHDIGTLGGNSAVAFGVNEAGVIVGTSANSGGISRPFKWSVGQMVDLGVPLGYSTASARDINNQGVILCSASTGSTSITYLLHSDGSVEVLPGLGGLNSAGRAINDQGQVVGYSQNAGGINRPTIWEDGQVYDLNTLIPANSGWVLDQATGINNAGQICGTGTYLGQIRAFRLTPVNLLNITSLAVSAGSTSATVTWNTNTSSNSAVEFGYTTAYGHLVNNTSLVTNHSLALSTKPATLYHYRVTSTDASGRTVTTSDQTFVTGGATRGGDGRWAYTLTRNQNGSYSLSGSYTYLEQGQFQSTLINARLVSATLGPVSASGVPFGLGTMVPGETRTFQLTFPSSAGSPGASVPLRFSLNYDTTLGNVATVWGSFRAALP